MAEVVFPDERKSCAGTAAAVGRWVDAAFRLAFLRDGREVALGFGELVVVVFAGMSSVEVVGVEDMIVMGEVRDTVVSAQEMNVGVVDVHRGLRCLESNILLLPWRGLGLEMYDVDEVGDGEIKGFIEAEFYLIDLATCQSQVPGWSRPGASHRPSAVS